MRTIYEENYNDFVQCFDEQVYLQERNIIKFAHIDGGVVSVYLKTSDNTTIATYYTNESGAVTIDVTDYLRVNTDTTSLIVECSEDNAITIPLTVNHGINPESVPIPQCAISEAMAELFAWDGITGGLGKGNVIIPPTMMYFSEQLTSNQQLYTRMYPNYSELGEFVESQSGEVREYSVTVDGTTSDTPSVIPVSSDSNIIITLDNGGSTYEHIIKPRPTVCGKRYALVQWFSPTNGENQLLHIFEVRGLKSSTDGAFSLETLNDAYNTIKGRKNGFSLYLDNLSAYDLWYYSDLIHSSGVYISFDGTNWSQLDVLATDVTIPDGDAGELNKLEIAVNYKHYDAVTL